MIEERDANPTADTPGRLRERRAPTALTAGGTESLEVVARLSRGQLSADLDWAPLTSMHPRPSRGCLYRGGLRYLLANARATWLTAS
jgi:hypothetical protein